MGKQVAERFRLLPPAPADTDLYANFRTRFTDLNNWITGLSSEVPQGKLLEAVDGLFAFLEEHRETLCDPANAVSSIDIHAENALYTNGTLLPIDSFPPKAEWKLGHREMDVYRLATDIRALAGEDAYRAMKAGYEAESGYSLRDELERFWNIYASSIQVPYLYFLGKKSELHREAALKMKKLLMRLTESET